MKIINFAETQVTQNVVNEAGGVSLGGWIGIVFAVGIILFITGGIIALFVSRRMFEKQIKTIRQLMKNDKSNVYANG